MSKATGKGISATAVSLSQPPSYQHVAQAPFSEPFLRRSHHKGPGRLSSEAVLFAIIATVLVGLPIIAAIAWLASVAHTGVKIGLASASIGGTFTQTEAKAIDFLCGAIIAPCILTCLNFCWFACARVAALTERRGSKPIPLATLVEASSMNTGSYDLFKIFGLWRTKRPSLVLFSALVLSSALAWTSFGNVIAYEAFNKSGEPTPLRLRRLSDGGTNITTGPALDPFRTYHFNSQQQASFGSGATSMLTSLVYQNATDKLDGDYYVGVNVTSTSMGTVSPSIITLLNVPGYRLSIECSPQPPDTLSVLQMGQYEVDVNFMLDNSTMFISQIPGQTSQLTNPTNDDYTFAAFSMNRTGVYIGTLSSSNLTGTNHSIPSAFGNLVYNAFNMTGMGASDGGSTGFSGTKAIMSAAGLSCGVFRQNGVHDYTRSPDQSWRRTTSRYSDGKYPVALLIGDWQTALNFHTPISGTLSGFGPALTTSAMTCAEPADESGVCTANPKTDYRTVALNFLYAAGEFERMAYEVANQGNDNTTSGTGYQKVEAISTHQSYRITYVPLILLVGLISVLLAASIPLALMVGNWRTTSFRSWREVNGVRLLVDAVNDLRDEPGINELQGASNRRIGAWAQRCKVQYVQSVDEGSPVRLARIGRTTDRDE